MNGLILSGGQSSRMGREKRLIQYHGKTQEAYLFELLGKFCEKVFVSLNANQHSNYPYIYDAYHEMNSPLVGILSAFQHEPEQAWLVVACDMPFVTHETIQYLIDARDISQKATAFKILTSFFLNHSLPYMNRVFFLTYYRPISKEENRLCEYYPSNRLS
jgi:molybdopterin-guanine dinucleotide biosynthesis protein A